MSSEIWLCHSNTILAGKWSIETRFDQSLQRKSSVRFPCSTKKVPSNQLSFSRQIPCKFFRQGDGVCPFGSKCFYSHLDKSGRAVQLPPPRRRVRLNERGELENYSDVLMASIFANEDIGRYFDEYVLFKSIERSFSRTMSFNALRLDTIFCSMMKMMNLQVSLIPMTMTFIFTMNTITRTTMAKLNRGIKFAFQPTKRREMIFQDLLIAPHFRTQTCC